MAQLPHMVDEKPKAQNDCPDQGHITCQRPNQNKTPDLCSDLKDKVKKLDFFGIRQLMMKIVYF